ncbi:MAG TPA: hypothetical protein HPQ03_11810 [Deltaproteobacteria bacterium]|nr:hypothetical protein [Deltaproteobacteria bacterium]
MAFVTIPGIEGKVYVPDEKPDCAKKHNCRDCHSCQMCGDTRCQVCRTDKPCRQQSLPKNLTNPE